MSDAAPHTPPPLPAHKLVRIFMCTNLGYLLLVYVWMFGLPAMTPDYLDTIDLPWGYRIFLQQQVLLFGTWTLGYHFVNLALLYGCMVSLFFFTWHLLRGPIWFGSLAATLMMAHPLKTEAVLQASGGAEHLLPTFFALACLALYAANLRWGRQKHFILALSAFALLSPVPTVQLGLLAVLVVLEVAITPKTRNRWRPFPFAVLGILAQFLSNGGGFGWDWKDTATTLFLTVYPFGLQPETQARMTEASFFMPAATLLGVALVAVLGLLVQHRAYWVALAGALAYMTLSGDSAVDSAHFVGGGTKILPIALVAVAFCALVQRMFDAEEWRRPLVLATALLCVFFFGLQIREISHWKFAAQEMRKLESHLKEAEDKSGVLVIAPLFERYHTAPMAHGSHLSNSLLDGAHPGVALVYKTFLRGETYHLKKGDDGSFRLYHLDASGKNTEVPLQKVLRTHGLSGNWHEIGELRVVAPYGVQKNGGWVVHTPKTWVQRLREWEMRNVNNIQ